MNLIQAKIKSDNSIHDFPLSDCITNKNYPGVLDILSIWFKNYKFSGQVEIEEYDNIKEAMKIINNSKKPYEVLKGYWLEKK